MFVFSVVVVVFFVSVQTLNSYISDNFNFSKFFLHLLGFRKQIERVKVSESPCSLGKTMQYLVFVIVECFGNEIQEFPYHYQKYLLTLNLASKFRMNCLNSALANN